MTKRKDSDSATSRYPSQGNAKFRDSIGGIVFDGKDGMTRQAHVDECDINRIMARYLRTGILPGSSSNVPRYVDVTGVGDYLEAQLVLQNARSHFQAMPSRIRERFGNDPLAMLEFLSQDENREEAIKLGLVRGEVKAPVAPVVEADKPK